MDGPTSKKDATRAGADALTLLSAPLNVQILEFLQEEGPKETTELRQGVGFPPQSTMRLYLKTLLEIGAIESRRRDEFPAKVDYEIAPAGRALLQVGAALRTWLGAAPDGPIELGSPAACNTIKALVEGWSTTILRALAARPLSLTELSVLIPRVSYPAIERRLHAMRLVKLLETRRTEGRSTPYVVTEWLRRAATPITAAIGWERAYAPASTVPVGRLDVEAVFLLAIPLLELPEEANGKCRLAVEVSDGSSPVFAGVIVSVQNGEVISCVAHLDGGAEAWAAGKPLAWLRQLNNGRVGELEIGGDRSLAEAIAEGLRRTAYEPRQRSSTPPPSLSPSRSTPR